MIVSYILNFQIEGPQLMQHGFKDAIAKVGLTKLISNFFVVGLFYHLYNQVYNFMACELSVCLLVRRDDCIFPSVLLW